ncbi:hypothetical protein [Paraliomyxa miuraensis]|uniref:hypothetical protein n=1 Tax=Paraliomyxa miuraensis TaxID=376150 RepID=UPI002254CB50|nr:hypothetical protein [Paraliomyxa miuraensis]MCX4247807.1 hypothetical protein [Paraliomyxa miuraensis]
MRPVGFSTGALAKGDVRRGLELQRGFQPRVCAVELSALRAHELAPFQEIAGSLDLAGFDYVSVHAPSRLGSLSEQEVFERVESLPPQWPIVAHPEILRTPALWRRLGSRLCLENMDNRKTTGRNASEMRAMFREYPQATFCLDVGHARQIDPTMSVALHLLLEFGERLSQLHVSEVGPRGEHLPVGATARWAFERIAHRVPTGVPLVIESVVGEGDMERELEAVLGVLGGAGEPRASVV